MKPYLKLIRIHHYIKNLLTFAPLAFSGQLFYIGKLADAAVAFAALCMVSSTVYILNDIRDAEKDRFHPVKRSRPIAAGTVSVKNALILAAVFLAGAAACNDLLHHKGAGVLLALYLILNLGYSFGLKDVPLVDIMILSSGFLIRLLYGGLATGITVSNWLYLTVLALAFYFALGKRRNERRQLSGTETRCVLKFYPLDFLNRSMNLCLVLAIVFYALWSMETRTSAFSYSQSLSFTVPAVLLIVMRYSLTIEISTDGDPVEILLHDKVLLALCLGYFAILFAAIYL